MLNKRIAAGREARKVLNLLARLCPDPKPKKRHVELHPTLEKPQDDVETASQSSQVLAEERFRLAEAEVEMRKAAKANNATYYHRDLQTDDDIRLLRIEPGEGPISGTLEYATLADSPPSFDALSYCWGEQKNLKPITIDSKEGFLISDHLHSALLRLRRNSKSRLVWIDVICVNQANIPERNRSVELMWRIYTNAQRVIIWIGEIDANRSTCKRLFPGTEDANSQLALCAKPGLAQHEHGNLSASLSEVLQDLEFESARHATGGEVWWKRLWVIQEFSCARDFPTVYLGPHAISWKFFSDLMHTDVHDRLKLFHHLRTQDDQNLFALLDMAKIFHCSDPRDRIYALLGLAKEGQTRIVPDYSKPVPQVYEEATLHIIREEQNVDVLLDEEMSRGENDFPTWVPHFRALLPRDHIQTLDGYTAGDGLPEVNLIDRYTHDTPTSDKLGQRVLGMKALHFDTITRRTTQATLPAPDFARRPINAYHFHKTAMSHPLETLTRILEELQIDFTTPAKYGLDRLPSIGYLMLDYIFNGTRGVVAEFDRVSRSKTCQHYIQSQNLDIRAIASKFNIQQTDAMEADVKMSALWESVFLWTRHTRSYTPRDDAMKALLGEQELYQVPLRTYHKDFFSTSSGFIGLGPMTLEVGDEIIVPFGASRPFIVRQQGDHHVLVGGAVVPGIMSGQLMNLHREGSLEAKEYFLR